jgi:hypothetical protein
MAPVSTRSGDPGGQRGLSQIQPGIQQSLAGARQGAGPVRPNPGQHRQHTSISVGRAHGSGHRHRAPLRWAALVVAPQRPAAGQCQCGGGLASTDHHRPRGRASRRRKRAERGGWKERGPVPFHRDRYRARARAQPGLAHAVAGEQRQRQARARGVSPRQHVAGHPATVVAGVRERGGAGPGAAQGRAASRGRGRANPAG